MRALDLVNDFQMNIVYKEVLSYTHYITQSIQIRMSIQALICFMLIFVRCNVLKKKIKDSSKNKYL